MFFLGFMGILVLVIGVGVLFWFLVGFVGVLLTWPVFLAVFLLLLPFRLLRWLLRL